MREQMRSARQGSEGQDRGGKRGREGREERKGEIEGGQVGEQEKSEIELGDGKGVRRAREVREGE